MWNASQGIRGNQNDIESNTCTIVIQQLIFICKRKKNNKQTKMPNYKKTSLKRAFLVVNQINWMHNLKHIKVMQVNVVLKNNA